ncbi:MAG: hypothetical protein QM765_07785 [Myxococcales bacterium]
MVTEKPAAVLVAGVVLSACATAGIPVERFLPAEGCYEKVSNCDPSSRKQLSRVYASGNSRITVQLNPLWRLATDGVPDEDEKELQYRKFLTSFWGMSTVADVLEARAGALWSEQGVVFGAAAKAGDVLLTDHDEHGGGRLHCRSKASVFEATDQQVVIESSMECNGTPMGFSATRDYWTAGKGLSRRDLAGRCLFEIRRVECPADMWKEFSKLPPRAFDIAGRASATSADGTGVDTDHGPTTSAKASQEALVKLHDACATNSDCGVRQRCLKWFAEKDGGWKETNSCELRCNPIRGDRDCPSPLECLRTLDGVTDTCQNPGIAK